MRLGRGGLGRDGRLGATRPVATASVATVSSVATAGSLDAPVASSAAPRAAGTEAAWPSRSSRSHSASGSSPADGAGLGLGVAAARAGHQALGHGVGDDPGEQVTERIASSLPGIL